MDRSAASLFQTATRSPLRYLAACVKQLRNFRTLAFAQGQFRSIAARGPVDGAGAPIPWYTYPALEYLKNFDFSDCEVFEFGAGNSSRFWAGLAKRIVSVENDPHWFEQVRRIAASNQLTLLCENEEDYVAALGRQEQSFDVIVIDGKWRERCADESVGCLKIGGLIILDNSDRHHDVCAHLRGSGFFQIDFNGFGPINGYCWTTSVFVKSIPAQPRFRGPQPLGGLRHDGH